MVFKVQPETAHSSDQTKKKKSQNTNSIQSNPNNIVYISLNKISLIYILNLIQSESNLLDLDCKLKMVFLFLTYNINK